MNKHVSQIARPRPMLPLGMIPGSSARFGC